MPVAEFQVKSSNGEPIGIVHVPVYEKWGAGHLFARPPYAMSQDEKALKKTITTDSRGAHLIAAVNISKGMQLYQWRQRVQITNHAGVLVDMADYDRNGDGKPDPGVAKRVFDWDLDRQDERTHEWYWSRSSREQAVYRNKVYWDSLGKPIDSGRANQMPLFEDNPNQATRLLGDFGPGGTWGTIKKHPITGMPYARELNEQIRIKFATALIETPDPLQPGGGRSVLRFTWGFFMDYDGSWRLYPLKRDDD